MSLTRYRIRSSAGLGVWASLLIASQGAVALAQLSPYAPSAKELAANYQRANDIGRGVTVYKQALTPNWLHEGEKMWYVNRLAGGRFDYVLVDCAGGKKSPLFDLKRLSGVLPAPVGKKLDPDTLELQSLAVADDLSTASFRFSGKGYKLTFADYTLAEAEVPEAAQGGPGRGQGRGQGGGQPQGQGRGRRSPDGKLQYEIAAGKLKVTKIDGGGVVFESKTDQIAYANWASDSTHLAAFRLLPGDHREVALIQSSPSGGGRAVLKTRQYDLPGDKLDTFETFVFDVSTGKELKSDLEPFFVYGLPWASPPSIDWWHGGKSFLVDFYERGYGAYRIEEITLATGKHKTLLDEREKTFVDSTALISRVRPDQNEFLVRSERDGWGRLYRLDGTSGAVKGVLTPSGWVTRSLDWIDDASGRFCFSANCTRQATAPGSVPSPTSPSTGEVGEDPYFIHWFTAGLDGSGLVRLTEGDGNHSIRWSPNRKYIVDTYSRVDLAPVHELRSGASGQLILKLESADASEMAKAKLPLPEVFVAKGRDGKTDIWGVVYRPSKFNRSRRYPVIENLYAGPQDSFAPKSFSMVNGMQRMAELGFIVVQMDGMGTRNRGKAFRDVCYKNLADAGFADRILWMKALAKKYPQADISRVGVYGTSAGGQSATGAMLFHPEFYKVAVSSCGCHDNRMDKQWWNEQWMGVMGPHYEEQSNITNAAKLQGRLMLMVGELDTNVPPESTYRLVDALIKANKDFEFVVLPGLDHTSGGAYGERKRRDFFVRWLLGVPTPEWK
ncbi:MAG: prolyl oligopeptidase family serine peptidase [Armatimonadetes bacterium]|nr:prolyl oligopeptidase family serine peptidase [Armatimonadota bacterium]